MDFAAVNLFALLFLGIQPIDAAVLNRRLAGIKAPCSAQTHQADCDP
jgi:hypothetical protein